MTDRYSGNEIQPVSTNEAIARKGRFPRKLTAVAVALGISVSACSSDSSTLPTVPEGLTTKCLTTEKQKADHEAGNRANPQLDIANYSPEARAYLQSPERIESLRRTALVAQEIASRFPSTADDRDGEDYVYFSMSEDGQYDFDIRFGADDQDPYTQTVYIHGNSQLMYSSLTTRTLNETTGQQDLESISIECSVASRFTVVGQESVITPVSYDEMVAADAYREALARDYLARLVANVN